MDFTSRGAAKLYNGNVLVYLVGDDLGIGYERIDDRSIGPIRCYQMSQSDYEKFWVPLGAENKFDFTVTEIEHEEWVQMIFTDATASNNWRDNPPIIQTQRAAPLGAI
ncbi:hypothetical protein PMIN04_013183 [Paraphaeosphaeria minitans]